MARSETAQTALEAVWARMVELAEAGHDLVVDGQAAADAVAAQRFVVLVSNLTMLAKAAAALHEIPAMTRKAIVDFDVTSLAKLSIEKLREGWSEHLGGAPPPLRTPELLRRELAWRLEARTRGDIEPSLRQRLDVLARQDARGIAPSDGGTRPSVGSTLTREWDGVAYSVVVLDQGFLFEGETHRSLSKIARQITGARWSGPRFFGLTEQNRETK